MIRTSQLRPFRFFGDVGVCLTCKTCVLIGSVPHEEEPFFGVVSSNQISVVFVDPNQGRSASNRWIEVAKDDGLGHLVSLHPQECVGVDSLLQLHECKTTGERLLWSCRPVAGSNTAEAVC